MKQPLISYLREFLKIWEGIRESQLLGASILFKIAILRTGIHYRPVIPLTAPGVIRLTAPSRRP